MARRGATVPAPRVKMGPVRTDWPPTCSVCGWQGEVIVDVQSPYLACGGDQSRHIRK